VRLAAARPINGEGDLLPRSFENFHLDAAIAEGRIGYQNAIAASGPEHHEMRVAVEGHRHDGGPELLQLRERHAAVALGLETARLGVAFQPEE